MCTGYEEAETCQTAPQSGDNGGRRKTLGKSIAHFSLVLKFDMCLFAWRFRYFVDQVKAEKSTNFRLARNKIAGQRCFGDQAEIQDLKFCRRVARDKD